MVDIMHDMATKAIYNNILFCNQHPDLDPSLATISEWKKKNWREVPLEALFRELSELGVEFDKAHFLVWADESDSPEDLLILITPDEVEEGDTEYLDRLYLIIFELWRRLIPERRPLSIIGDDIDHALIAYESLWHEEDEMAQISIREQLIRLFLEYTRLLQATCDQYQENEEVDDILDLQRYTTPAHAIFAMTQPFFVHDISRSLFDFILEELSHDTYPDLMPLVEGIMPFILPSTWSMCMKAHILWYEEDERAMALAKDALKLIFPIKKENNSMQGKKSDISKYDLVGALSILLLAAKAGEKSLFRISMNLILDRSLDELSSDELFELVSIAVLYAETVDHAIFSQLNTLLDDLDDFEEDIATTKKVIRPLFQRLLEA